MVYFKFRIIKQKKTKKQGKKDSLIIFNWDNFIYLYRIYIRKGANGSAVFGRVPKNSYTVRNHLTVRLVTLIFAFELFQISWQIATDRVTEQAHTGISVIGILHCPNILLSKRSSFFFLFSPFTLHVFSLPLWNGKRENTVYSNTVPSPPIVRGYVVIHFWQGW